MLCYHVEQTDAFYWLIKHTVEAEIFVMDLISFLSLAVIINLSIKKYKVDMR